MGFFRRNIQKQQQEEEGPPPSYQTGQEELVVEVQDGNFEQNRKPRKDQVCSIEEITAADMNDNEQDVEIDLASFRKIVPEEVLPEEAAQPTKDSNKRRTKLIVAVIALFATILVIVLAVTLTSGRKDDPTFTDEAIEDPIAETPNVDLAPDYTSDDAAYLMEILQVYTPIEVLTDPSIPQGAAFLELLKDEESNNAKTPPVSVEQRYALQMLYLSTSPDGWTNSAGWDTADLDECSWEGVVGCTTTDNNVQAVSNVVIENNNLVGTIPTELCILGNSLQQLGLADNLLEGSFPECLCSLQNLADFSAAGNQLAGTIPNCLVEAPSLSTLNLAGNDMTGTIPPFGVTMLENVDLRNNQLTGRLDGLFVAASNFEPVFAALRLDDNQFVGTIPDLSEVATLTHFTVTGNQLTGEVTFCEATPVYEQLEVDCFEVDCTCCTNC